MRILVLDIPASSGGALSVLNDFFHYVESYGADHEWTFLVSTAGLQSEKDNIRIIQQSWPKRSFAHRIYWELFKAHKVIQNNRPDVVLTFQNTPVLFSHIPQIAYIHQSAPFITDKSFSVFVKEERPIAVYRFIFDKLIKAAVKKSRYVLVQTKWMRDAIAERYSARKDRIIVVPPAVKIDESLAAGPDNMDYCSFFYPCGAYVYKNIEVIINAVRRLVHKGLHPVVRLTVAGDENEYAVKIKRLSEDIRENIILLGQLPREKVFQMYRQQVLLFASYLETVGLPLLEAQLCGSPIIAADRPFSREILEGYPNAIFFDAFSEKDLELKMLEIMDNRPGFGKSMQMDYNDKSLLKDYDITNWNILHGLLDEMKRQL